MCRCVCGGGGGGILVCMSASVSMGPPVGHEEIPLCTVYGSRPSLGYGDQGRCER